jgi:hypothetical protein
MYVEPSSFLIKTSASTPEAYGGSARQGAKRGQTSSASKGSRSRQDHARTGVGLVGFDRDGGVDDGDVVTMLSVELSDERSVVLRRELRPGDPVSVGLREKEEGGGKRTHKSSD